MKKYPRARNASKREILLSLCLLFESNTLGVGYNVWSSTNLLHNGVIQFGLFMEKYYTNLRHHGQQNM